MNFDKKLSTKFTKDFERDIIKHRVYGAKIEPVLSIIDNLGVSKTRIAEFLGLSPTSISHYISGKRRLPDQHRETLYELLEKIVIPAAENVKKREEKSQKMLREGKTIDFNMDTPRRSPKEQKRIEQNYEWRYQDMLNTLKKAKKLLTDHKEGK